MGSALAKFGGGRRWTLLAVAAIGGVLVAWLWRHRTGVAVIVHNEEPHVVRAVEVSTTAGVYVLGDLAPSSSAQTVVGARGESTVRVAWTDAAGERVLEDVGPYFEAGPDGNSMYGGEVCVTLRESRASAENDVGLGVPPFSRGRAPAPDRTGPERYPR